MSDHEKMVQAAMKAPDGPGVIPMAEIGAAQWAELKPVKRGAAVGRRRVYALTLNPVFPEERSSPDASLIYMVSFTEKTANGMILPNSKEGQRPFIPQRQLVEVKLPGDQTVGIMATFRGDLTVLRIPAHRQLDLNWVLREPWMEIDRKELDNFVAWLEAYVAMSKNEDDLEERRREVEQAANPESGYYESFLDIYLEELSSHEASTASEESSGPDSISND